MNAVEIEEAVSALADQPFDAAEFPFAFLQAFGNKETTLKRLRKGESNKSDVGGVLQTNNIHIAIAPIGEVTRKLEELRASPAYRQGQGQIHPGDGWRGPSRRDFSSGNTVACAYKDFRTISDSFALGGHSRLSSRSPRTRSTSAGPADLNRLRRMCSGQPRNGGPKRDAMT